MDHAHQLTTVSPPFGSAADAAPFCLGSAQNLTQCPTLGCRGSSGPRHGWAKDGTVRPSPSVPAKRPLAVAAAAGIAFPASRAGTQVLSMASGSRRDDGADGADEGPMAAALDAADRRLANNAATSSQCRVAWWNCQIARPSPFRVRIAADWRGGLGRVTSGLPATTRAQCPPANRDRSRTAKLAPLRSGLRGDSGPTRCPRNRLFRRHVDLASSARGLRRQLLCQGLLSAHYIVTETRRPFPGLTAHQAHSHWTPDHRDRR